LEEIAVRAGHEVLMEVGSNFSLTVFDPQGILNKQLRPYPFHVLNMIIFKINYLKLYFIKLFQLKN
jgi:hypothetical protein